MDSRLDVRLNYWLLLPCINLNVRSIISVVATVITTFLTLVKLIFVLDPPTTLFILQFAVKLSIIVNMLIEKNARVENCHLVIVCKNLIILIKVQN